MRKFNFILVSLISFSSYSCFQDGPGCEGDVNAKNGINIKYVNQRPNWIVDLNNCNLNGVSINFYDNGKISKFGYGKNGKEIGEWLFYDSTGKLVTRHIYNNGNLEVVTDHTTRIVFDRKGYILNFEKSRLDLSKDDAITKSHYSEFIINNFENDTIVFNSEKKILILDSKLNIINSLDVIH